MTRATEDSPMTPEALTETLRLHAIWRRGEDGGKRADLSGADIFGADLSGANLSGADLSGADLSGADIFGADLSGANLSRADMFGANLSRANMSGADLSGADIFGANLSRANMSGADLSGADLSGADLSGADLSGADIFGADLSGAKGIIRVGPATDDYEFFGVQRDEVVWIKAGCRWFTAADARAHWLEKRKDTPLGAERLRFVDFIEAHFKTGDTA